MSSVSLTDGLKKTEVYAEEKNPYRILADHIMKEGQDRGFTINILLSSADVILQVRAKF